MVVYSTAHWSGGLRGAGLGNEALVWAKSYVAAEALGHRLLAPQWLLNRYDLHQQLGLSRAQMASAHLAGSFLAKRVTEAEFLSTESPDYGRAMQILAGRGAFVGARTLVHEGMWGGWRSVRQARPYLSRRFQSAPGVVAHLAARLPMPPVPVIGVHVRRGDFSSSPPGPGDFNKSLPLDWYAASMQLFRNAFPKGVRFWVCSDGSEDETRSILGSDVEIIRGMGPAAPVQELMTLATADTLIASVSSFSMLAAFLSDKPYLWYERQLTTGGLWSRIWTGRDADQARANDVNLPPSGLPRGIATDASTPLPYWLVDWLSTSARLRMVSSDLLYFGQVPVGPPVRSKL